MENLEKGMDVLENAIKKFDNKRNDLESYFQQGQSKTFIPVQKSFINSEVRRFCMQYKLNTMNNAEKINVIMPVYNEERTIDDTRQGSEAGLRFQGHSGRFFQGRKP